MKHILYTLVAVGLLSITACSDKESSVPPITQPVGTGTYQPVASRKFYLSDHYSSIPYPSYNIFNIYSTEESFEYYYFYNPEAERVNPSEYSIIQATAKQTHGNWNIFGQNYYKVGENQYVLVAHLYPDNWYSWLTSALVPALPSNAEVGLLEMMHPGKCDVSSIGGSYELFRVESYPEPKTWRNNFEIIRTQAEYEAYFPERQDASTIDFEERSLLVGYWVGTPPDRQTFQFARTETGEYILSAKLYYDPNGSIETLLSGYCVLVPAVPEGATVGILTRNYWIDGLPAHIFPKDLVREDYTLPASFSISDDIPDNLFVIRTQEDFDRYFSAYPEAATFRFDWYSLLIARGNTASTVDQVECLYYNTEDYYEYALSVTLSDDNKPDTWYTALLVPKLDAGITPKLTVVYKNK